MLLWRHYRLCLIDRECITIYRTHILHSTLLNSKSYSSDTRQRTAPAAPSVRMPTQVENGRRSQISQNVEEYRTVLLGATIVSILTVWTG